MILRALFLLPVFVFLLSCSSSRVDPYDQLEAGYDAYYKQDYAKAFALLKPFAEAGDAQSQFFISNIYYDGEGGVKQDRSASLYWVKKAAENGSVGAQITLGTIYEMGIGVPVDLKESAKWLLKAAEKDPIAVEPQLKRLRVMGIIPAQ